MERIDEPYAADERTMLIAWLDWHRATVFVKCEGLAEDLAHRPLLASSPLTTVAGLVGHLRWVERYWFEHVLLGGPDDVPWTDDDPDRDFKTDGVPLAQLLAEYEAQCARNNEIAASLSLDAEAKVERERGRVTLRWLLLHMIEETARHNGHLDILRELLDGVTGD
ncbi:MAG: dinB superfamily protein [Actinoallomurus sp.]|nr:dinB superfamily protein [Actinoallomurus sp.]